MEQTHTTNDGGVKLCTNCGKPMAKIEVQTARRDYELWTCVPCIKEADRKARKQNG